MCGRNKARAERRRQRRRGGGSGVENAQEAIPVAHAISDPLNAYSQPTVTAGRSLIPPQNSRYYGSYHC